MIFRIYNFSLISLLVFFVPCTLPVIAQEACLPDSFFVTGDEVVITATRSEKPLQWIPSAVSVIDLDQIQAGQKAMTIDEPLTLIPGTVAQNRQNYELGPRISIRGFGSRASFGVRGIRILVDGVPMTTSDGQTQLDNIDLASASRIEVLRGPNAALYGNASGGVIQIFTEDAVHAPSFSFTPFIVGRYGLFRSLVKSSGQINKFRYTISGSGLSYDGYRGHSTTKNLLLNSKFTYMPNDKSAVNFLFSLVNRPRADSPGSLTLAQADQDPSQANSRNVTTGSGGDVKEARTALSYRHDSGSHHWWSQVYMARRIVDNPLPFAWIDLNRWFGGGGIRYSNSSSAGSMPQRLTLGIDIQGQWDDRHNFTNEGGDAEAPLLLDQDETVRGLGLYVQEELRLHPRLEISGALRYDRMRFEAKDALLNDGDQSGSRTLDAVSPSIGLTFHPFTNDNWIVFGNIATAFETPTTTELVNRPGGGGGFNPDLDPQKTTGFEIGTRGLTDKFRYEWNWFLANVREALISFRDPIDEDRDFYRNAGKSRHWGFETAASTGPWNGFSITGSYTYTNLTFTSFITDDGDFKGNSIPGAPRHTGGIRFQYTGQSGWSAQWETRTVSGYHVDDANSVSVDAYTVTDLRLRTHAKLGRWDIRPFIGINNLFASKYIGSVVVNAFGGRYFEPAPGFDIYGGITFDIGP
jgi:iron complex outermembrane recepter protein